MIKKKIIIRYVLVLAGLALIIGRKKNKKYTTTKVQYSVFIVNVKWIG